MIVHDYGSLAWPGAEKAVDEFFADKPECIIPLPDSAGSVAIRKLRQPGQGPTWMDRRRVLTPDAWYATGNGDLAHVLTSGWSVPEGWGIWGVGEQHLLTIATADATGRPMILECETEAFLPPGHGTRIFDAFIDGAPVTTWEFTTSNNKALRALVLPNGSGPFQIAVRTRDVFRVRDVVPTSNDDRPLGIALHRLRLRFAE
jgi:hypothetical protein